MLVQSYARLSTLIAEDQLACFRDYSPSHSCLQSLRAVCSLSLRDAVAAMWIPAPHFEMVFNHFESLEVLDGVCSGCSEQLEALFDSGKEKSWRILPSTLGLPAWDELTNFAF
jgi:hypothetical protein